MIHWESHSPIYQQLKQNITMAILDGDYEEQTALPSIRQLCSELHLNPNTVSKAYHILSDENIIEKKRGLGMYVKKGARNRLLQIEKKRFLNKEWPKILQRVDYLGLSIEELLS
mgnify:CR=1 FL=1